MPSSVTLTSATGLTLTFADSDLRSIGWPDRPALTGPPQADSAAGQLGLSGPFLPLGPLRGTELSPGEASCAVTQTYDHAAVRYDYSVANDDVRVDIALTHLGKQPAPIRVPRFSGWTADFSEHPKGNLSSWHPTYFAAHAVMHPSTFTPVGGHYLAGDGWGLGFYTERHLQRRKLFHLRWERELPPLSKRCVLEYFVDDTIWPDETHRYDVRLSLRKSTDWRVLLAPYRDAYRAAVGPMRFEPDHRPAAAFTSVDKVWVRPDNPLGYNDLGNTNFRRFDRVEGVKSFVDQVAVPLAGCGGLGVVHWALMGYNPRGAMYRPDFDVFPPEVRAQLPALTGAYRALNLRAGLCVRPGEGVTPVAIDQDVAFRLCASSADQVNLLLQRFKNVAALGFDFFYFDSFGATLDDLEIMKQVRAQLGPDVPCLCEFHSDLLLPYAGRYTEWHGPDRYPFASQSLFDISRFLMPDLPILCRVMQPVNFGKLAELKLSPMVEDHVVRGAFRALEAFGKMFLDGKKWKS